MLKRMVVFIAAVGILLSTGCAFAAGREIVKFYSDVNISEGMEVDDIVVIGGSVTISGKVKNGVVIVGGSVELKPGSFVGENVVAVGGGVMKWAGAQVGGKITEIDIPHFMPSLPSILKGGWIALWATISVLVLLGFLGLAILFVALIPEHISAMVGVIQHSLINMFLWGALWIMLIVPVAVLLAISIIGIALIPLEILLVVLALVIGYIASAIFVGKNVLMSLKKSSTHAFIDAIVGIVILFLVGFVPVVGQAVKIFFLISGFGAVITTRFGTAKG